MNDITSIILRRLKATREAKRAAMQATHDCFHADDMLTHAAKAKAAYAVEQELDDLLLEIVADTTAG